MTTLVIAPASNKAARYAVEHWHYSKCLPTPPLVRFGIWEDDRFVGVVIFGRGGTSNLLKPYGLDVTQGAELVRIACRTHVTPISQLVMRTINELRGNNPGLRLLVSYADPSQGHHGGIYQAMNWIYTGQTSETPMFKGANGKLFHSRVVSKTGWVKQYGVNKRVPKIEHLQRIVVPGKHRYLFPLDKGMRRQVSKLTKPYPPAVEVSEGHADFTESESQVRSLGTALTSERS